MGFDFEKAAAKAENKQNKITSSAKTERKTVRINISLSEETNAKLTRKSTETGISKSALIQHWIHENC